MIYRSIFSHSCRIDEFTKMRAVLCGSGPFHRILHDPFCRDDHSFVRYSPGWLHRTLHRLPLELNYMVESYFLTLRLQKSVADNSFAKWSVIDRQSKWSHNHRSSVTERRLSHKPVSRHPATSLCDRPIIFTDCRRQTGLDHYKFNFERASFLRIVQFLKFKSIVYSGNFSISYC